MISDVIISGTKNRIYIRSVHLANGLDFHGEERLFVTEQRKKDMESLSMMGLVNA